MVYDNNYTIWRLMIDKRYQKRGYGKEVLNLALDFIKNWPCGKPYGGDQRPAFPHHQLFQNTEVYVGYRKAGYSKRYLSAHESDIIIHKAAKKAFDELGLKKLPTVRSLQEEYATLLAQKKADYAEYYKLEKEKRDLLIYKANTERLLNLDREETKNREHQREEK